MNPTLSAELAAMKVAGDAMNDLEQALLNRADVLEPLRRLRLALTALQLAAEQAQGCEGPRPSRLVYRCELRDEPHSCRREGRAP